MMRAKTILLLLSAVSSGTGCGRVDALSDQEIDRIQAPIINGTIPAAGALAGFGVVSVGGFCTGTLLNNQFVLTAHHCTGRLDETLGTWTGTLFAAGSVTISLTTPTGTVTAHNAAFFEPPGNASTWTVNGGYTGDFALIQLDQPISVDEINSDTFQNNIYAGDDSGLLNQSVLCMGYGARVEATANAYATDYELSSALMTIDVASLTLKRNRHNNIVGFAGDSGSTCYDVNNNVIGVQSTCDVGTWIDSDHNGVQAAGYNEVANVPACDDASPGSYRDWALGIVDTDVSLSYDFVPNPGGLSVTASVFVDGSGSSAETLSVDSTPVTFMGIAPRSGRLEAHVDEIGEPANMMCPRLIQTTTPLSGTATIHGTCLGDGLMSLLL